MAEEGSTRWWPFVAGLAAGAVLGVFFAPRSGKETRATIRDTGRQVKDDVDEAVHKARTEWASMKGKAHDAASMSKEEVDDLLRFLFNEGRDLFERVKKGAENSTKVP
jgi:gas vesicle protein